MARAVASEREPCSTLVIGCQPPSAGPSELPPDYKYLARGKVAITKPKLPTDVARQLR